MTNKLPILLVTFNRKDLLNELVDSVRSYSPCRIYISSDGPRNDEEAAVVFEVRTILTSIIDWDCHIEYLYHTKNLGCKYAVDSAIRWFFSKEEKGIVLEDDCIPTPAFFTYCEKGLEELKDRKDVGLITGRNELEEWGTRDCFLSTKFICWGWASWSDRFINVDVELGYRSNEIIEFKTFSLLEYLHIRGISNLMKSSSVNSWAYAYDFNFRRSSYKCLVPRYNLVSNIGFGPNSGTHSSSRNFENIRAFNKYIDVFSNDINHDSRFLSKYLLSKYGWIRLLILALIPNARKLKKKYLGSFNLW